MPRRAAEATVSPDRLSTRAALQHVVFVALVALCAVRLLLAEAFTIPRLEFLDPRILAGGPTPGSLALLDGLSLTVASLGIALTIRWREARPLLPDDRNMRVIGVGIVLLIAGLAVSAAYAANPRAAANASSSLAAGILVMIALCRLAPSTGGRRLLLAALIASCAVNAVKCLMQVGWELEDTAQFLAEQKSRSSLGQAAQSPLMVNYERRVIAGEAFGYQFHPNILAGCLLAGWVVIVGWTLSRSRKSPQAHAGFTQQSQAVVWGRAFALTLAVLIAAGIWTTGSLGAIVAGAAGVIVWLYLRATRAWPISRQFGLIGGAYVALCVAGAIYGGIAGGFPHPSLDFRWTYWVAGIRGWLDHWLTGVGRENFLGVFIQYKPVIPTEEVRNAHNLWVTLLVEAGPLGLLGGALAIAAVLWRMLRRAAGSVCNAWRWDWLATGVLVALLHAGFGGVDLSQPAVMLIWAIEVIALWIGIAGLVRAAFTIAERCGVDLQPAIAAAFGASLLHNTLDMSFFVPAGLAALALLVGAGCAGSVVCPAEPTSTGAEPRARRGFAAWGIAACLIAAPIAHYAWITAPTQRSELALSRLTQLTPRTIEQRLREFISPDESLSPAMQVTRADPCNSDLPLEIARVLLGATSHAGAPSELAVDALRDTANALDRIPPHARTIAWTRTQARLAHHRSLYLQALGRTDEARRQQLAAAELADRACEQHPTDARGQMWAGLLWARLAADTPGAARRARSRLDSALNIDSQLSPADASRLRAAQREEIETALAALPGA